MTTEAKDRIVRVTIKSLAQKKNVRDEAYLTLETLQTGLHYSIPYQVWDVAMAKGFQAGDHVVLKLHRGKAKREGADEAAVKDWYWDVVGIQPDSGAPAPVTAGRGAAGPHPAEDGTDDIFPTEDPPPAHLGGDPWYRYIAWGDVAREARLIALDQVADSAKSTKYSDRFKQAFALICTCIREEQARQ